MATAEVRDVSMLEGGGMAMILAKAVTVVVSVDAPPAEVALVGHGHLCGGIGILPSEAMARPRN